MVDKNLTLTVRYLSKMHEPQLMAN